MNLVDLTTTYLKSLGYDTNFRGRDLLIGHKLSAFGEREEILVWIPAFDIGQSFGPQEAPYLSRFDAAIQEYPRAQRFMLVTIYEGLSRDFRSKAKTEYDVNVRVPILFFDTPFKIEESTEARAAGSAARELGRAGEEWSRVRVPQPYGVLHGMDAKLGSDLLNDLVRKIKSSTGNRLNLVVGPAGMGKTVLFQVLFSQMYSDFQKCKSQLRVFPRPLPLVPEYIRASVAPTLRGLVEGFIRTEFAAPIGTETFEWMLVNGFGIWLLDGLDEMIERDSNFFNDLLDILTKPGTVDPTIILCLRDSLLATNQGLREFIDEYEKDITIYELSKWGSYSKRAFAKIEFKRQQAEQFMTLLQTHEELNNLSSIPYYCKLIAEEYKIGKLQDSYTELELLNSAITNIIEREYSKGLLDRTLLPSVNLIELLQDLAYENATQGFRGLTRETIQEYTEILLPAELDRETQGRLVTQMVQLAVFCQGSVAGYVQFAQEILEHYLLGERLYRNFCTNEGLWLREISRQLIPTDWVTLKTVANRIQSEGKIDRLLHWLQRGDLSDIAFRNILQIYAYAITDTVALKKIPFEGRNMASVKLSGFDLRDVSFRRCNLTDAEFDKCLLQNSKFVGSIINHTTFLLRDNGDLKGADFGDMERIYSVRTQPRRPEMEYGLSRKWLRQRTGVVNNIVKPCAAALQLRYLFSKYVYPDGTAKRAILDRRGVIAGKEFYDRDKALDAAVRHGYLIAEVRYRDRIQRCDGDMYSEMVNYVKDLILPQGLRRLLNDICSDENCQHVPKG